MQTRTALPQLGDKILIVLENAPHFLDELRAVIAALPTLTNTFFTLMACCPPHYWEHGGADNPDVLQELEQAWNDEQTQHSHAEVCLDQARAALLACGVPAEHVITLIAAEETSALDATLHELKRLQYTGVILSAGHDDIVHRLHKDGLTDFFRHVPKVTVLAL
jgi:hypothetical protein